MNSVIKIAPKIFICIQHVFLLTINEGCCDKNGGPKLYRFCLRNVFEEKN